MAVILGSAGSINAQDRMEAGIEVGYGISLINDESSGADNIGNMNAGGFFQYVILENIQISAGFNVSLKNDWYRNKVSFWDTYVDFHFLYPISRVKVYPLLGVSYSRMLIDYGEMGESNEVTQIGCNLGAGASYFVNDLFSVRLEVKYNVNDFNAAAIKGRVLCSAGIAFNL